MTKRKCAAPPRRRWNLFGLEVDTFSSAEDVLELIGYGFSGVVVSDIRMPGMDGMTLLQRIREIDAEIPVILVTGHGDVQLAVKAMREGVYDFLEKPFTAQHLAAIARRALDRRSLVLENRACAPSPASATTSRRGCPAAPRRWSICATGCAPSAPPMPIR